YAGFGPACGWERRAHAGCVASRSAAGTVACGAFDRGAGHHMAALAAAPVAHFSAALQLRTAVRAARRGAANASVGDLEDFEQIVLAAHRPRIGGDRS